MRSETGKQLSHCNVLSFFSFFFRQRDVNVAVTLGMSLSATIALTLLKGYGSSRRVCISPGSRLSIRAHLKNVSASFVHGAVDYFSRQPRRLKGCTGEVPGSTPNTAAVQNYGLKECVRNHGTFFSLGQGNRRIPRQRKKRSCTTNSERFNNRQQR